LSVAQDNSDVIFSGYSRKPFETKVKIRGSVDGGNTWFTSLEIDGADAVTSIVIDRNNTNKLYAASVGENGGVLWKSNDRGSNWENLNDYFNFTTIHSFAAPSNNSSIAYAGVWGGGTYRTDNSGSTWEKLESDESFSAATITLDPNDANIVYLADRTQPIVHKSINGGQNWSEYFNAGQEHRRIMFVTIDPINSERIYVSTMKMGGPGKLGGLYKIENGVITDINGLVPRLPLTITIDPKNSNIIYLVLHESGIYKSINSGNSWSEISGEGSNLPNSGFNNLVIDPNNSNILYLIGGCDVRFSTFESAGLDPNVVNGVYKSVDAGATWTNINYGILGNQSGGIKSLAFHKNNSNSIYLGAENGVYYSNDGGDNWNKSQGLPYNTLGGLAISQNRVYAFTNGAGLFTGLIQADNSIKWDSDSKINVPVYFAQILKDHVDESIIYASGYPGGIFKSTDKGETWHEKNFGMVSFKVDDPLRQGYYAFAQSQSNPHVLYLGLFEKGVYRSSNGGDTWYPVNGQSWELYNKKITGLTIDNQNENIVYVASEKGIYSTSDGGLNWNIMNNGLASLDIKTIFISPSNQLYAGTRGYGLYQYVNNQWMAHRGFGNWGVIWPMWNDRPMYQYSSLLIHPADNSRMMLGTFPQGIYKSNDHGETWKESNIGWTNDGVFSLICHPENPEIVYAGTYNGMNRSTDFGEHWEIWDNGMPSEQWVFSIDFHPTNPDIMYACSKNGEDEGSGREDFKGTVMKSVDEGENWFEITNGLVDPLSGLHQEFYKIIVDHYDPNILYLAGQHEGIYISQDAGESWVGWNDGLENTTPGANGNNVTNTLVMSGDHSMLYFGTAGSGVWRRMISPILPVNKLSAQVISHKVFLNWSFDDLNKNFSHFNIYRSNEYYTNIEGMSPIASISSAIDTFYTDSNILEGLQYYYSVTTNDQSGYENDHFYVLGPVVDYPLHITSTTLDSGYVGEEYLDTLKIIGGDPPYSWEITSGALPNGLELLNAGIIEGVPKEAGQYQFRVKATDSHQPPAIDSLLCTLHIELSTSIDNNSVIPKEFALRQNYPNPFNPATKILYDLPVAKNVKIEVYNFLGQKISTLVDKHMPAGYHEVVFNTKNLSSGIYFYKIEADPYQAVKKAILLK